VLALLHELASEGSTLVLITHDEKIAASFPRRIQMRDGEIVGDERNDGEIVGDGRSDAEIVEDERR
jgi:putative ABC transport system ATP-binding protein